MKKDFRPLSSEIADLKERFKKISLSSDQDLSDALKLENMLKVSDMVVRSALLRTESRGAHYRSDFPKEDNNLWLKNIEISKRDGPLSLRTVPADLSRIAP